MDFQSNKLIQKFKLPEDFAKLFIGVIVVALIAGVGTGYILASGGTQGGVASVIPNAAPKQAQEDTHTFKDFAEGTLQKRPAPKNPTEYVEGTHILVREGAVPVALTSSVIDLSQYEGKKVKVFGETQKALKEGWLMDVGKVEVE
ncbi:hypothetical protein HY025_00220 [Candidatus Daviesbacteria bacterium]|nr:hypothetical protein [Candidatus Daviesbacteria bacterium]